MPSGKHAQRPTPSVGFEEKSHDRHLECPRGQPRPIAPLVRVRAFVSNGQERPHAFTLRGLAGQRENACLPIVAVHVAADYAGAGRVTLDEHQQLRADLWHRTSLGCGQHLLLELHRVEGDGVLWVGWTTEGIWARNRQLVAKLLRQTVARTGGERDRVAAHASTREDARRGCQASARANASSRSRCGVTGCVAISSAK